MTPLKKLIEWNEEKFMVINVVVLVTVKTLNNKRRDNYDRSFSICMGNNLVH